MSSLSVDRFSIVTAQAVVFAPGSQLAIPRLLTTLLDTYGGEVSGEPMMLPTQGRPDVPAIILNTEADAYQVMIFHGRAAFTWNGLALQQDWDREAFLHKANRFFDLYLREAPAKAGRFALILTRQAVSENPAAEIAEHFCSGNEQSETLRASQQLEIHFHKTETILNKFTANRWFRCRSAEVVRQSSPDAPPMQYPVISIEQDINTLAEIADAVAFPSEIILQFLGEALDRMESEISQVFPKGGAS